MTKNMQNWKYTWKKRTTAVLLAGTAAVIFAASPYIPGQAADAATGATTNQTTVQQHMKRHPGDMRNGRIEQMVSENKITQEQADKLKDAMKEFRGKQAKERLEFMKNLPKKTGIPEATLQQIFTLPPRMGGPRMNPQQHMQQLVQNGSITQQEATALETFFKNHRPDGDNQTDVMKKHTGERPDRQQLLKEMSEETGISTDRLQEIMKLAHPQGQPPMGQPPVADSQQ